jgi:hypothetical protein
MIVLQCALCGKRLSEVHRCGECGDWFCGDCGEVARNHHVCDICRALPAADDLTDCGRREPSRHWRTRRDGEPIIT